MKTKTTNYVVVVANNSLEEWHSQRDDGSWSSFIGVDKTETIGRAMKARERYEAKGYGPYSCYVGELNELVKVPINFKLVKL